MGLKGGVGRGVGYPWSYSAPMQYPLSKEMPLEVSYSPVGIGQLRLWLVFSNAMKQMESLGVGGSVFCVSSEGWVVNGCGFVAPKCKILLRWRWGA